MNAPWKANARDSFAAFICDEASLDTLRPIAAEMGWAPEKCVKAGLRNAAQSLSMASSPNILMVDLSESGDPLSDINALAEVCEPGTVVIAVGMVNDVRLYRDLLTSGIHDYLLKPLSPDQLRDALANAQAILSAPKNADGSHINTHVSTLVIGTRGGVGASTVASSLAWLFSTEYRQSTALLDLDIHFGSAALALDLEPGRGLTDAIDNPSRIDGLFIERAMIRSNDNLVILSAEAPINQPLITDGTAFLQLQEEFRNAFDRTVIDLPRSMLINFPQLTMNVQVAVIVTEMSLAGARDCIRIMSCLKAQAPHLKFLLVANKVHPGGGEISRADFEASIEHKLDFMVAFDLKAAINAAKLGQSFAEANRLSKAGISLRDAARAINVIGGMIVDEDAGKAAGGKQSLFAKLGLNFKKKDAASAAGGAEPKPRKEKKAKEPKAAKAQQAAEA